MNDSETDRKPTPAYVVEAAIADQKEHDEYAIVRSDGDYEYARTMAEAYNVEADMQSAIDHVAPIGHSVIIVDLPNPGETGPVSMDEVREYEDEHGEPHLVFNVEYRPERKSLEPTPGHEFVFYIYDDDPEDPRFSFWIETTNAGGMSLYERPPEGAGMWLKPETGSDHSSVEPSDEFEAVIADLMDGGLEGARILELPPHERHFVQVIYGTVEENPDAIPEPVWGYMHDVAEERESE